MPTECKIVFDDNRHRVFYAGQLLSARIELTLTKPKLVRGIFVEISGEARCSWIEGTGENRDNTSGYETYLKERKYLVGNPTGEMTIESGRHNYNFHCKLPMGLPTSLEAAVGYIRYKTWLVMDIPFRPNKEFVENFTVIKPLNLNDSPEHRLPAINEIYRRFNPFCCCCCCFPSIPMHVLVRIPMSGYTPGQAIDVDIEVNNRSDQNSEFKVQLKKQITYHANNSSSTYVESIMICEQNRIGLSPINTMKAFRTSLIVPPIPPTDELASNVCKVRYIVRVIGSVSGCHIKPTVDLPITIGTQPNLDNFNIAQAYPRGPGNEVASYSFAAPICQQPNATYMPDGAFPNTDPPTYEQVIKGYGVSGKEFPA